MKKHGFTLTEVLSVIVILGIVALISIPLISKVINKSKESTIITSVKRYREAIDAEITASQLRDEKIKSGRMMLIEEVDSEIEYTGEKPEFGYVIIDKKRNISELKVCYLGKIVEFRNNNYSIISDDCDSLKIELPNENLLANSMFKKDTDGWELGDGLTRLEEKYNGCNIIQNSQTNHEKNVWYGMKKSYPFAKEGETYTASVYVMVKDPKTFDNSIELTLMEYVGDTRTVWNSVFYTPVESEKEIWKKLSVTRTLSSANVDSVHFKTHITMNGIAYFACPKLEKGSTDTHYIPHKDE